MPGGAWVKDIEDDVKDRLSDEFGSILHIKLNPESEGDIYVKFSNVEDSKRAYQSLQGRSFNGDKMHAKYVPEGYYNTVISK